ncbi:uncharacterized protein LOC114454296 isoform X3 [Gouania willdenowi]|uniref:uncharacterized protein LOC114454296 isoform X3 n=1 Tax=Gouania willdenowi TaxID=441366 RepID=UPI001055F46D|nr:uncharacterized protein LOC114454296 isoform X3 [Gouania willdenowi]XP_028290447.1 uncharacterized protein LOC114454296 isoform X3 [Gouania willdenowi]
MDVHHTCSATLWISCVFHHQLLFERDVVVSVGQRVASIAADNLNVTDAHHIHDAFSLMSRTEGLWSLAQQISQQRPLALENNTYLTSNCRVFGFWTKMSLKPLVQNGVAVYATWATLSSLLNMTIYLQHRTETPTCDCALLALLLLLMELLGWFLLENFYLDEHVRYILTIYPVVTLWLTGVLRNFESSDTQVYTFAAFILAISVILFVVRVVLVTWRHQKKQLFKHTEPILSPVEISLTQNSLFL